jgi:RNA polymerase sigma-70 factor (ECF subfamily)
MSDTRSTLLVRLRDPADQTAWRTFDQLYRPLVVGYAVARGLDSNDADDVAQQCVQAVLGRINTYEHSGSFKTWLRAIAEKKICDCFRARRREVQADSEILSQLADADESPAETWEKHWWKGHFRFCAESVRQEVSPSTYSAFISYAIEGRPAGEVAQAQGLTVNQVYVAKHRILERMRGMMAELTGSVAMESVG